MIYPIRLGTNQNYCGCQSSYNENVSQVKEHVSVNSLGKFDKVWIEYHEITSFQNGEKMPCKRLYY